jgi:hypothetical protein
MYCDPASITDDGSSTTTCKMTFQCNPSSTSVRIHYAADLTTAAGDIDSSTSLVQPYIGGVAKAWPVDVPLTDGNPLGTLEIRMRSRTTVSGSVTVCLSHGDPTDPEGTDCSCNLIVSHAQGIARAAARSFNRADDGDGQGGGDVQPVPVSIIGDTPTLSSGSTGTVTFTGDTYTPPSSPSVTSSPRATSTKYVLVNCTPKFRSSLFKDGDNSNHTRGYWPYRVKVQNDGKFKFKLWLGAGPPTGRPRIFVHGIYEDPNCKKPGLNPSASVDIH